MKKLIAILACSLALASCSKDDDNGTATTQVMKYDQTYCADKWSAGTGTDSASTQPLQTYLTAQSLFHANVSLRSERPAELCAACQCRTGRIYYVTTLISQEQRYLDLGFKK